MKFVKFCLLPVVVLFVLAVAGGYFWVRSLPTEWSVSKSVLIDAPVADVHAQVSDLRNWEQWSFWFAQDPNTTVSYDGEPGAGQTAMWQGNSTSGRYEILEVTPDAMVRVQSSLQGFPQPTEYTIEYEPDEEGAFVTWTARGTGEGLGERMMGFLSKGMSVAAIEFGLEQLGQVVQAGGAPTDAAAPAEAEAAAEEAVEEAADGE